MNLFSQVYLAKVMSLTFQFQLTKKYLYELYNATLGQFKNNFKKELFTVACNAIESEEANTTAHFKRIVPGAICYQPPSLEDQKIPPKIQIFNGPYEYKKHEWYVIFANKNLGGGYLANGFVQEEVIMMECPELAILVSNFDVLGPMQPKEVALYQNIYRAGNILIYGRKEVDIVQRQKKIDYKKDVIDVKAQTKFLNFLAIDAVNISNKPKASKADLTYTYEKLLAGFQACGTKIINTGKLGCGAYGNDVVQIFILTVLAGWASGVDINFYLYDGTFRREVEDITRRVNSGELTFEKLHEIVLGKINIS